MLLKEKTALCESPAVVTEWKVAHFSAFLYELEARLALFAKIVRSVSLNESISKSDFYMEATKM